MKRNGDPMTLLIILLILLIAATIVAFFLGRWVESNKLQRQDMQRQLNEMQAQVENLGERLNGRHLSNRAVAGIEDATAIAIDLVFEVQTMEARLGNLRQVLGILRNQPEKYDPEREAGKRMEKS
jgi:hypothetical protein